MYSIFTNNFFIIIFNFKDYDGSPLGPFRVWLKDQDIPGLAMARAFGDIVAS